MQILLSQNKIAETAVIFCIKMKNQWSESYFKVAIYNKGYKSISISLNFKQ